MRSRAIEAELRSRCELERHGERDRVGLGPVALGKDPNVFRIVGRVARIGQLTVSRDRLAFAATGDGTVAAFIR